MIAAPLAGMMWLFGPLVALGLLALATGYCCIRAATLLAARSNCSLPASAGVGMFTLFNPWVYNEVVAGHLIMVLAYAGVVGALAEMLRGRAASPVRLALWLALVELQLQFFIIAIVAVVAFAFVTRKWLAVAAGIAFVLPSAIGIAGERSALLAIPYSVTWQANQSVAPLALSALGGYFPGYSDRLGPAAQIAVWTVLAMGLAGVALTAWRSRAAFVATCAAAAIFVVVLGVNGPLAAAYAWTVRHVPESGVFRELYDLAGIFAALVALLACTASGRIRQLGYLALAAGLLFPITWIARPPSDLWVGASNYPHPGIVAPPFTRVALLPEFQPLALRDGKGDGADPDSYVYPGPVAPLNAYLPAYPADMALASYAIDGDDSMMRALGVETVAPRPWFASRSNGRIGLAAESLSVPRAQAVSARPIHFATGVTPLVSACQTLRVVLFANRLGRCAIFFGDAPGYPAVSPMRPPSDSLDPQTDWIDARFGFTAVPQLAQGIGGTLTQSRVPYPVRGGSVVLAYVRGRLQSNEDRTLDSGDGKFRWLAIPTDVTSVSCAGLCELVAQADSLPALAPDGAATPAWALDFHQVFPWLYFVNATQRSAGLLRLDERYDPAWIAIASWHLLPHVRIDASANGWLVQNLPPGGVLLLQLTSLLQAIAEIAGALVLLWLLKALTTAPTNRAR